MHPGYKAWNEGQQELRLALKHPGGGSQVIGLFLRQHAMIHSAAMSGMELWSFEDEVWEDLSESAARRVPDGGEHSIAWIVWHLTRCEDITMNLLVAHAPQVISQDNWLGTMNSALMHTGNHMSPQEVAAFGSGLELSALRAYRSAVGRRTRQIAIALTAADFKRTVEPAWLEQVLAQGALLPEAQEVYSYWGRCTVSELLLMPATRHNTLHFNEALKIKKKVQKA
jgi:hypothetical protein